MSEYSIKDLRKCFEKGLTIEGANLEPHRVKFGTFNEFFSKYAENDEEKASLLWFEKYFDSILLESQTTTVTPMQVVDGQVVIEDGMIFHRCTQTLETLKNISKCLLATEWFGVLEQEGECRLCTSLNTVRIPQIRKGFAETYVGRNSNCVLYFDTSNPLMQKLLKTDYYRYAELKRTAPEEIKKQYSPEMIKFIEHWILPNSKGGMKYHSDEYKNMVNYDWWAIPGGIPAELVNGVGISSNNSDIISQIEEIAKMFPNAVIFDENRQVLYSPLETTTDSPLGC